MNDPFNAFIASLFGAMLLAAVFAVGSIALIVASPFAIGYGLYYLHYNSTASRNLRAAQNRRAQHRELKTLIDDFYFETAEAFGHFTIGILTDRVNKLAKQDPPILLNMPRDVINAMGATAANLYRHIVPERPPDHDDYAWATYLHMMRGYKLGVTELSRCLVEAYLYCLDGLPEDNSVGQRYPAVTFMHEPLQAIQQCILAGYMDKPPTILEPLTELAVERIVRGKQEILPTQSKMKPREAIDHYLNNTPFEAIFDARVSFSIPTNIRTQHFFILGSSGHGKTQVLQRLIADDLPAVEAGRRSVVVIDSNGEMLDRISNLAIFAPGEPLHEKVVVLSPKDTQYPLALNLFDANLARINTYDDTNREMLLNTVLELYDFMMGALLGSDMTSRQATVFRFVVRLMMHIPNANIQTLKEIFEPNGLEPYRQYFPKLDTTARAFFEHEYSGKQFNGVDGEIRRRLYTVLENRTFERMFSSHKNKLDLFTELNAGKIVLIDTAKSHLRKDGSAIFGRFFFAMLLQAAQERITVKDRHNLPNVHVYVDEAHDIVDDRTQTFLEEVRKNGFGLTLATQGLYQLPNPHVLSALMANTRIRMVGTNDAKEAGTLAPQLRTTSQFLLSQATHHFATFINGVTPEAISVHFPWGHIERMDTMTPDERDVLTKRMQRLYCTSPEEVASASSNRPADASQLSPSAPGVAAERAAVDPPPGASEPSTAPAPQRQTGRATGKLIDHLPRASDDKGDL